jgi:TPR repeat protein
MAMAAGFLGAMAVSVIIALVVMNVVHHRTVGADVSTEEGAAKGHSLAAATLGDLAKVSEAQAKMTRADEPAVLPETPPAAAPPNEIAAPKSPAAVNSSAANLEPTPPEIVAPAASPAPAANAVPEPRPSPSLPPDEIAFLIKRGRDLIAAGDIASARLVLTLVAEAGDAEASFILASTFDPVALANLRVVGVPADPAKARAWYARAAELGSLEARQRLQALR